MSFAELMPLLDESMQNLTCDLVFDEERFRGDVIVFRIWFMFPLAYANSSVTPIRTSSLRR
jgi:hypothetical protein